jgi:hypothetical protein
MKTRIPVYSLDWHIRNSDSMNLVIDQPLCSSMDLIHIPWNGVDCPVNVNDILSRSTPTIFYQLPPPEEYLSKCPEKLIWIPMWDQARSYSNNWWNNLPWNLRVVSFSNLVAERAKMSGVKFIDLRFFLNPEVTNPAQWKSGRVMLYWNRVGLFNPGLLKKLCKALGINILFFRDKTDPEYSHYAYRLPTYLGKTRIIDISGYDTRNDYLKQVGKVNVFISPRQSEGIGLTMLEALAQGCAVFGCNAPTMNEYILHNKTGYLLDDKNVQVSSRYLKLIWKRLKNYYTRFSMLNNKLQYHRSQITADQNWNEISNLDLKALGDAARADHYVGYAHWRIQIKELTQFILSD